MAAPIGYAILSAAVLIIWLLTRIISRIIRALLSFYMVCFFKFYLYLHLSRRFPILGTRLQLLVWSVFVAVNIACITIGTSSSAERSARSATMSLINVIPLLCGPRLVMMMKLLGITLRAQHVSHTWLGLTAMAQALVHSILSARNTPFQWTKLNLWGVVVCHSTFSHNRTKDNIG
jgi:hypothetical protein